MTTESPLDRASWSRRSEVFRSLREHVDPRSRLGRSVVVMEYAPPEPGVKNEWRQLRELWLDLPVYPNMLEAIESADDDKLLLRYAAIDWSHQPVNLQSSPRARHVARWGAQLTDLLRCIWNDQLDADARQFLCPLLNIDIVGDLRVGFLPVVATDPRLPPEAQKRRPRIDEMTAMYVIGRAVSELCTGMETPEGSSVRAIIERCLEPKPSRRFKMLEELHAAWKRIAVDTADRTWEKAEEGIGWLELGKPELALGGFDAARRSEAGLRIAETVRRRACLALGIDPDPPPLLPLPPWPPRDVAEPQPRTLAWSEVVDDGLRLENDRDFGKAVALYRNVKLDGENDVAIQIAIARCYLGLGAAEHAVDSARRALTKDPRNAAALSICARGHLLGHKHDEALRAADAWLAAVPDDASGHYARGRCLFALGRLTTARDAFDRACSLRPQLVEAMLLRREVDRALQRVRAEVGTPVPLEVEVPEHLAALRDALVGGRVEDVVPLLERAEYDRDGIAKLVHAECLAFARRFEEAIAMYDRAAALSSDHERPALLGKARAYLALDRATEALAQLDRARERWPDDMELADIRSAVLTRMGDSADAANEFGRVVVATHARSDARIGRR